jgi:hypothetical protein
MAQQDMPPRLSDAATATPCLDAQFEAIHLRLDALDRRLEQRTAEIRVKQEEELMLVKAMSCQLRGRVERVDRRHSRSS